MIYMWVQAFMCHWIYVEFRGQLLGLGSLSILDSSWNQTHVVGFAQSLLAEPSFWFFLLLLFFKNYICIWKWIYKVTSFYMGFSYLLHFSWYPLSSFLPSISFSYTSFDPYYCPIIFLTPFLKFPQPPSPPP